MNNQKSTYIDKRIAVLIESLGISANSYAVKIDVKATVIYNILKVRNKPSFAILDKIISVFNVSPNWLMTGTGEMFNSPAPTPNPRPNGSAQSHSTPADSLHELSHYDAVRLENLILLGELVSKAKESLITGLHLTSDQLKAIAGHTLTKSHTAKVKASITLDNGCLIIPLTLTNNIRSYEQNC